MAASTTTVALPNVQLEDGRIAEDLPCECGYNLRTMEYTSLCPECGGSVESAVEFNRRSHSEIEQLKQSARMLTRIYLVVWAYGIVFFGVTNLIPALPHGVFVVGFGLAALGMVLSAIMGVIHGMMIFVALTDVHAREAVSLGWRLLLCPPVTLILFSVLLMLLGFV